jgi:hypothetical protein
MSRDPLARYRQIAFVGLSVLIVAACVCADISVELKVTQTVRDSLYQQAVERQLSR